MCPVTGVYIQKVSLRKIVAEVGIPLFIAASGHSSGDLPPPVYIGTETII